MIAFAWTTILVLVSLTLLVIAGTTLRWMLYAWQTPGHHAATGYPPADGAQLSFSVIVPCRDEPEHVMRATVERLLAQSHPDFEILISVGDDDVPTVEVAHRLAAEYGVRVSVNTDPVKNKPRQLNSSLRDCTKAVVGVIDAESITHPDLLLRVDAAFRADGADAVQGSVHLVNHRARWFTLRNCLEYRTWFRSRLHWHADAGFIPLGGNTVFVRRRLLEEFGGWDGSCLAEDCDLGVRLSVAGRKVACAYDPALTTREEAPESVRAFVKQRTRWALGFMQVLAKGEWKQAPTRRQRWNAWWTLMQQHTLAFSGIAMPIALASLLIGGQPPLVAMLTFLPALPMLVMIAFELVILREFGRDLDLPIGPRDYLLLVVSTPAYQLLLAYATVRAMVKYVQADFHWEKTPHTGAHLELVAGPERSAA